MHILERGAGKDALWDHTEEETSLKARRCSILQPMFYLDEDMCHGAAGAGGV